MCLRFGVCSKHTVPRPDTETTIFTSLRSGFTFIPLPSLPPLLTMALIAEVTSFPSLVTLGDTAVDDAISATFHPGSIVPVPIPADGALGDTPADDIPKDTTAKRTPAADESSSSRGGAGRPAWLYLRHMLDPKRSAHPSAPVDSTPSASPDWLSWEAVVAVLDAAGASACNFDLSATENLVARLRRDLRRHLREGGADESSRSAFLRPDFIRSLTTRRSVSARTRSHKQRGGGKRVFMRYGGTSDADDDDDDDEDEDEDDDEDEDQGGSKDESEDDDGCEKEKESVTDDSGSGSEGRVVKRMERRRRNRKKQTESSDGRIDLQALSLVGYLQSQYISPLTVFTQVIERCDEPFGRTKRWLAFLRDVLAFLTLNAFYLIVHPVPFPALTRVKAVKTPVKQPLKVHVKAEKEATTLSSHSRVKREPVRTECEFSEGMTDESITAEVEEAAKIEGRMGNEKDAVAGAGPKIRAELIALLESALSRKVHELIQKFHLALFDDRFHLLRFFGIATPHRSATAERRRRLLNFYDNSLFDFAAHHFRVKAPSWDSQAWRPRSDDKSLTLVGSGERLRGFREHVVEGYRDWALSLLATNSTDAQVLRKKAEKTFALLVGWNGFHVPLEAIERAEGLSSTTFSEAPSTPFFEGDLTKTTSFFPQPFPSTDARTAEGEAETAWGSSADLPVDLDEQPLALCRLLLFYCTSFVHCLDFMPTAHVCGHGAEIISSSVFASDEELRPEPEAFSKGNANLDPIYEQNPMSDPPNAEPAVADFEPGNEQGSEVKPGPGAKQGPGVEQGPKLEQFVRFLGRIGWQSLRKEFVRTYESKPDDADAEIDAVWTSSIMEALSTAFDLRGQA